MAEDFVLKLVVTNNVYVFRYLGMPAFQRLGATYEVAADAGEALQLIRSEKPQIAILDTDLADGSGYEVCKTVKADEALRATHVILVERSVLSRKHFDLIAQSGCDDVLALPVHPDDFYHHLAQVAGLPHRRNHRVPVSIEISVSQGEKTAGKLINISTTGAGAEIEAPIEKGPAVVRLRARGQEHDVKCRVAWCHPHHSGTSHFAGLDFVEVPAPARSLLDQVAMFEITRPSSDSGDTAVTVFLQGDFDERTDFTLLAAAIEGEEDIDFNLQGVRYIGSSGVRAWCRFLENLDGVEYTFRHCSLAFTTQAAMVPLLMGTGRVVSVEAPYHCARCDRDELRLIETSILYREKTGHVVPPPLHCASCGGALEFDDIPDRYFAFLGNWQ